MYVSDESERIFCFIVYYLMQLGILNATLEKSIHSAKSLILMSSRRVTVCVKVLSKHCPNIMIIIRKCPMGLS